jgi:NADPH:quinone reductase-like Zn-dependent oxidoreductase
MASVPETMTAIEISTPGGPEVLKPKTMPTPKPAAGQILVKVAAAGVNRPDLMQRAGLYPPPPGHSPLPGLEIAGEVAALGAGDGARSSTAAATPSTALPRNPSRCPAGLDMVQGAARNLLHGVEQRSSAGGWRPAVFLVHGGTSGVGTAHPACWLRRRVLATQLHERASRAWRWPGRQLRRRTSSRRPRGHRRKGVDVT